MNDTLPRKRPKRAVLRFEKIDDYPCGGGWNLDTRKTTKVWKICLDCGHYVIISRKKWASPPRRWRCVICGTKKEAADAEE